MLFHLSKSVDRFIWIQKLPENIDKSVGNLLKARSLCLVLFESDQLLCVLEGTGIRCSLILGRLLKLFLQELIVQLQVLHFGPELILCAETR